MKLIDTHCHLDFPEYDSDREQVIERAIDSGVVRMIVPGVNLESSLKAAKLAAKYDQIYFSAGIHPHYADGVNAESFKELKNILSGYDKCVAIGEVGLDYYRKNSSTENQRILLKNFLELSSETDLPLILHNRSADEDFLDILNNDGGERKKGVFHCFSAGSNFLKEILSLGFFVSFTGNITFEKAADIRRKVEQVPIERLMLETDSPYITPVPYRGKRNEPVHVKLLLKIYSDIYGISSEDVARVTSHNANRLFRLGIKEEEKIVYPIRDSLYLNITNRCTNRCSFCTREQSDFVMGHKLRLSTEPTEEQIIDEIKKHSDYKEVVFCGYGESTLRLGTVKRIAGYLKKNGCRVRLTTNGEGDLINSRNIAPELKGLIDQVSISMNAFEPEGFRRLCHPVFGDKAFEAVLDFIENCVKNGIEVEITCVDVIGEKGVARCRQIAEEKGARFRVRRMDVVG